MNFLAHLILSGDNEDLRVGNFIGDFVKGSKLDSYPADIRKGILLHRAIDAYTDSHETVHVSKRRIRAKYGHYAPVIVDLYYDHLLAKNWNQFFSSDLKSYTLDFYRAIKKYSPILPDQVKLMLTYMEADNWLYNYGSLEGISQALAGMARRAKFDSHMEEAAKTLRENYEAFEGDFLLFFPQLQTFANKQVS